MFDFTRFARVVALTLPAYLLLWPAWAIVGVLLGLVLHTHAFVSATHWLAWPLPAVFAVLSLAVLIDFWRRLGGRRLTRTQATAYRVTGVLMAVGAAFALSTSPVPVLVAAIDVLLMLPTAGRAQPSSWTPK